MLLRISISTAILGLTLFTLACSGAPEQSQAPLITTNQPVAAAPVNADNQVTTSVINLPTAQEVQSAPQPVKESKLGNDNSEIYTETSPNGAQVSTRTFQNHPRVTMVIVRTQPDGDTTGRAYAKTGEVRSLPDTLVASALTTSGDRIADALGFTARPVAPPPVAEAPPAVAPAVALPAKAPQPAVPVAAEPPPVN